MKSVLLSINPEYCYDILQGRKTIEVRKTKPSIATPFKCYIYCTKPRDHFRAAGGYLSSDELYRLPNSEIKYGCSVELAAYDNYTKENFLNGTVIGEFMCEKIDKIVHGGTSNETLQLCILDDDWTHRQLSSEYLHQTQLTCTELETYSNGKNLYGWHISNLVIYDKPKELNEFTKPLICHRGLQNNDCIGCWDCEIKRPPRSWCYVKDGDM